MHGISFPVTKSHAKRKKLSLKVTFSLNRTPDKTKYKKDLDNMLKILMGVIKQEMDDNEKIQVWD
jgi:hypothetical protein